jgi:hypothetical protein
MYEVTIRKPLKHPESNEGLVEMRRSVNHELHALNLAERIVRMDRVPWVEVREVNGRFQVRASLEGDGRVHGSLKSQKYNARRKSSLEASWMRWPGRLAVTGFVLSGVLSYAVSNHPGDKDLKFAAELITFVTAILVAIWAYTGERRRAYQRRRHDGSEE